MSSHNITINEDDDRVCALKDLNISGGMASSHFTIPGVHVPETDHIDSRDKLAALKHNIQAGTGASAPAMLKAYLSL